LHYATSGRCICIKHFDKTIIIDDGSFATRKSSKYITYKLKPHITHHTTHDTIDILVIRKPTCYALKTALYACSVMNIKKVIIPSLVKPTKKVSSLIHDIKQKTCLSFLEHTSEKILCNTYGSLYAYQYQDTYSKRHAYKNYTFRGALYYTYIDIDSKK
jgi:hypothetical protein